MNEAQLLEELVPHFDEPPDWDDVLRRSQARRLPRRRLVLTAAVLAAALVVGPALGVLLTRDRGPQLPAGADRSRIAVVISPVTGRVLLKVAPWKGHRGFCYLLVPLRGACVPRSRQTVVTRPPLFGWTFDPRVVSGWATTLSDGGLLVEDLPERFFHPGRQPLFICKEGHVVAFEVRQGDFGVLRMAPIHDQFGSLFWTDFDTKTVVRSGRLLRLRVPRKCPLRPPR